MEAIILAGGFGSRLRQVVPDLPKPMAPVAGRPFLEILLGSLARKKFRRVILSLGFMAGKISGHFGAHYAGLELVYVIEERPLGTGGALRLAMTRSRQDHVFVFNGDTYLDLEVERVGHQWQSSRCPIIVGREMPDTSRYGRLIADGHRITGFIEKGMLGPGVINAGCYVLATDALNRFPVSHTFSLETDYLFSEVIQGKIELFVTNGLFIDIGIPEDYSRAQSLLSTI